MSRTVGAHTADPCPRCFVEAVRAGELVRVDLPNATLYGSVWQIDGDRVQVRHAGGEWLRWVQRWRVIVY
ncbi:hypothetical protein [Streptomyces sp. NPDC010273]|uniref:hypothetical protein n=1 Tax=Streptomyces sp. NPDC010273 TaxID=3364829 RepID=UPI0036F14862